MENKNFELSNYLAKVKKCWIFLNGYDDNNDEDDNDDTKHHQRLRPLCPFHLQGKTV
jgi:hypothetical protein